MTTLPTYGMSDRAAAGLEVYARNFGVDAVEAQRIMTERAGAVFTREAFEAAGGLDGRVRH
jgi:4-carboxymuconolactone decarboxylase